jgi:hypothetical protein
LTLEPPVVDGHAVTISGSATPGSASVVIERVTWDWGDGSGETRIFAATHTYATWGTYTVSVTAYQSDGQFVTRTTAVEIERTYVRRTLIGYENGKVTPDLVEEIEQPDTLTMYLRLGQGHELKDGHELNSQDVFDALKGTSNLRVEVVDSVTIVLKRDFPQNWESVLTLLARLSFEVAVD